MCHCKWAHQRCKDQLTYLDIIDGCGSDQREFFKKIEKMFHGTVERSYQSCAPPSELANKFADFFDNKIKVIAADKINKSNQTSSGITSAMWPYQVWGIYIDKWNGANKVS